MESNQIQSPSNSNSMEMRLEEIQGLNIENRNNFLHFLSCCQNKNASIDMYECSETLACNVEAFQPDLRHIAVSNLMTPIGTVKHAVIRTNDLIDVKYFINKQ